MHNCCIKTYKETLEEVRYSIKALGIDSVAQVLGMLHMAILVIESHEANEKLSMDNDNEQ